MVKFNFQKYPIYKESLYLNEQLEEVILLLDNFKRYGLKEQLDRAAVSITHNISEGFSRKHKKDYKRFLNIALGSLNETMACFDILLHKKLVSQNCYNKFAEILNNIAKQLNGLIRV